MNAILETSHVHISRYLCLYYHCSVFLYILVYDITYLGETYIENEMNKQWIILFMFQLSRIIKSERQCK
jgi:hypothetical protein